jgi:hypothetical protein
MTSNLEFQIWSPNFFIVTLRHCKVARESRALFVFVDIQITDCQNVVKKLLKMSTSSDHALQPPRELGAPAGARLGHKLGT